jgi:hypothetical protein
VSRRQPARAADTGDPGNRGNARGSQSPEGPGRSGGTAGNERLTAMTGAALLVLFAAEGVTILSVRGLLTLHFFVGMISLSACCWPGRCC